jgi:glucose-1-phosphate thymidylyltransferase
MIPIGTQPILERVLEAARAVGVEEFVFVVGHERERIQTHFGDGDDWNVEIQYAVQEHQLGAAHALSQVVSVVDSPFLALHGDQLVDEGLLNRLLARWEETATPTIAAVKSDRPTEYGAVQVDGETVHAVSRTPTDDPPFLVNGGAYVFDERVFDAVRDGRGPDDGDFGMATALQRLADSEALSAVRHGEAWQDLTFPWDLLTTNATLVDGRSDETDRRGVHETASVSEHVAFDAAVSIGPNATVLPGTSLGESAQVGANATLSNCIVMAGAQIGAGATIHDCIVGEAARIGPNVTVEGGPADVVVDDAVHHDVRLGGVVADRATVGGNVTVTPGTVVGREVRADGGTVLQGRIASGERVRRA